MSGMSCGVLAGVAWPWLSGGLDAVVTVDDARGAEAMRALHAAGITAGESGAAGLAGLVALLETPESERRRLGLNPASRVLLVNTEGATDPENWGRIVQTPAC